MTSNWLKILKDLGSWDSRIRLAKKAYGLDDNEIAFLSQLVNDEANDFEGIIIFEQSENY